MIKFSEIISRNELAEFLGVAKKNMTYILYVKGVDSCYHTFEIPKKSGGVRVINAPTAELANIQRKLADAIWNRQMEIWKEKNIHPNVAHGFIKHKSIITNAQIHRNKKLVLNLDLEDFFNSFHFGRVKGFFEKNNDFKMVSEVATIIAQLTCYKGALPQGAPTSPVITNLICNILDMRILKIAKKYRLDYTRYADDLSFSTNNQKFLIDYKMFYEEIDKEVKNFGLNINAKKTRLQFKDSKQVVTGLVVNKKINVDHNFYRKTRAMAHSLYSTGEFYIDGVVGTINQLEGRFSFINQLDRYNNQIDGKKHWFRMLNGREKEYQKFLFYKYFYANSRPLIVTEGKTDITYIKAALKNLYVKYPTLIEKKEDGTFKFKVSFLKKTKRLDYFLGISMDGADAMKHLYNYFSPNKEDKKVFCDYATYFEQIARDKRGYPIILLFDNECEGSKRPLGHFINYVGLDKKKKEDLQTHLYVQLIENRNLYLLTNSLVDEKKECEIEDLFKLETLGYKIDGREFTRQDNYDTNKYYGKNIFSKYIEQHYKEIDFSGFIPLLEAIEDIAKRGFMNKSL